MAEGCLYVCATPIGNLEDASERLRRVLDEADIIYAEDTRRTAKLLSHLGVTTPTRSLFAGNEVVRTEELVGRVAAGQVVALVSDAGMPTVSDPGTRAVAMVRAAGLPVLVIPGPSAVITAVAMSGLGGDRFIFEGFLPRKGEERDERIARLVDEDRPVVIFASPNRLARDLTDLRGRLGGDRQVVVTRELTKVHEEVWSGSLQAATLHWADRAVKGELTLVLGPAPPRKISTDDAVSLAFSLLERGMAPSAAARDAAKATGAPRRVIYGRIVGDQDRS